MGWRERCAGLALGLLTISGAGAPARAAGTPAITGETITAELGAGFAGYQVLLVTPAGMADIGTVTTTGNLRLDPDLATRDATLTLLDPAGRLIGPLVLAVDKEGAHTRLSGTAADLGAVAVHADFASAHAARGQYTGFVVRAADGRPLGAGNGGTAAGAAGVPAELLASLPTQPGGDADSDGIINLFDRDDDGDQIPDSRDPDAAVRPSLWTTVAFGPDQALNTHTSDVTGAQLAAALPASGLTVHVAQDTASLPAVDPLSAAFVVCPATSWCAGTEALITAPDAGDAGQFPTQAWADYTGTTWTIAADGSASNAPTAVTAPGWALHSINTLNPPPTGPDGLGASSLRWRADVLPQPQRAAGLPTSDQVLLLRYRTTSGALAAVALLLDEVLLTAPVINQVNTGTISGDALTSENGRLSVNFWRPQAAVTPPADPGRELALRDVRGLTYALALSDGGNSQTCAAGRFSELTGLVGVAGNLVDASAGEAATGAAPLGFTLDVAGCVADAQGALTLGGDQPLTVTLTATTGGQQAAATAVSYRLLG